MPRNEINKGDKQLSEGLSQHFEAVLETQIAAPNLIGSIKINTDSLEAASDRITALFLKAIEDTASSL
ncbi:MAG: hypothetical protein IPP57_12170 [Candidatus Obscuribacter sp.]|nr:hypothetical protein [Candidatus Obscuribacter sp.]